MATIHSQTGPYGLVPLWLFDRMFGPEDNRRKLSPGAICMYGYLSARFGGLAGGIYPSQEKLAEDLRVSVRTIQAWEADLRAAGALVCSYRGLGRTTRYTLIQVRPAEEVQTAAPDLVRVLGGKR